MSGPSLEEIDESRDQWQSSNGTGGRSTWHSFDMPYNSSHQDVPLIDLGFDDSLMAISESSQYDATWGLELSDSLVEDCILAPTSYRIDTEKAWLDAEMPSWSNSYNSSIEPSPVPSVSFPHDKVQGLRKERRRAQNRKAQQAFRERKDKAIQRLEREVEKLTAANQCLNVDNGARLREIAKLKTELEVRSSVSGSPVSASCFDDWDTTSQKRGSISSESTSRPTSPPNLNIEVAGLTVPWIKWRGRIYVDKEGQAHAQTKGCG